MKKIAIALSAFLCLAAQASAQESVTARLDKLESRLAAIEKKIDAIVSCNCEAPKVAPKVASVAPKVASVAPKVQPKNAIYDPAPQTFTWDQPQSGGCANGQCGAPVRRLFRRR